MNNLKTYLIIMMTGFKLKDYRHLMWILAGLGIGLRLPFPSNMGFSKKETSSIPGKGNMSFFNFKPWEIIATPVLTPESSRSFWTGVYGSFWFDLEPNF